MNCVSCGEPIPAARLQALPQATQCVPCVERAGDVPPVKRFDQYVGDDVVVEEYFVRNAYIEKEIDRRRSFSPPAELGNVIETGVLDGPVIGKEIKSSLMLDSSKQRRPRKVTAAPWNHRRYLSKQEGEPVKEVA